MRKGYLSPRIGARQRPSFEECVLAEEAQDVSGVRGKQEPGGVRAGSLSKDVITSSSPKRPAGEVRAPPAKRTRSVSECGLRESKEPSNFSRDPLI